MSEIERRTGENNLGIHGDAETAEELAGRGLNLMRARTGGRQYE